MKIPSIAIFGAGLVGARHVAEAAKQAELAAIVDPSEAAKALAVEYDVPHFDTPDDCLQSLTPDGVVIATPNHMHADHAVLCLDAGIPVLIEKPIADTQENADRIVAAADWTGVPVLVGHHRRHNPRIQKAKALIDEGHLGQIVAVHGQFWLYKPDDYFSVGWRKQPGAGPLFINFIHDIDLMRYLCGEVASVTSVASRAVRGNAVEDTAALLLQFESGALGTFSVSDTIVAPWSWEMSSAENPVYPHVETSCYKIGGTHGSLSVPDLTLWTHTGTRSWWEPIGSQNALPQDQDAFALQFAHFCDVIRGAVPLVSAQEGRASMEVVVRAASVSPQGA